MVERGDAQSHRDGMTGGRAGFSAQRPGRGGALAAALAVHVGVAGVAVMMPGVELLPRKPEILWGRAIPAPAEPPETRPVDPPKQRPKPTHADTAPRPTATDPVLPLGGDEAQIVGGQPLAGGSEGEGVGDGVGGRTTNPPADSPVFIEARLDPRAASRLQPDYPPAMLRLGREGSVTVRVSIDADGRVLDVALVRADDPLFFEATRRHALRAWRFKPATRDGTAVPSAREMTVHFRLSDL